MCIAMKNTKSKEVVGENLLTRKIGDKTVVMQYELGAKGYASEKLDREQARYDEALETVALGLNGLVYEMERTHLRLEDIKQVTCSNCGQQALMERKNRMRVFGGLFWTDSEPSPYKRCANCGHDQEHNPFRPPHLDSIRRTAERKLELAQKLINNYTNSNLRKEYDNEQ